MELAWPKGRRSSVLYKRNLGDHFFLLPIFTHSDPPFPPATRIVTKCCSNDSNEGFFIRRTAEIESFGAKNRAEFGSVGRQRDEKFCFWRLVKGETRRRKRSLFLFLYRNFFKRNLCNWCNCRGFLMFQSTFFLP